LTTYPRERASVTAFRMMVISESETAHSMRFPLKQTSRLCPLNWYVPKDDQTVRRWVKYVEPIQYV
jgi:hypothetical protein